MKLSSRFPSLQQNISVYAVIVTLLSGWTLRWLGWKLPSWAHYLTAGEILPMFVYAIATTFFETLFVLALVNVLSAFLPRAWFLSSFVFTGSLLSVAGLAYLMVFANQFNSETDIPMGMLNLFPLVVIGVFLLTFPLRRIGVLAEFIERLADRLAVFLYLFVPFGIISIVIVLLRNIF